MGYFLYSFLVTYKVQGEFSDKSIDPTKWVNKEAHYNVSAPNKPTAIQEVERMFSGHKDLKIILEDTTTVHCAIQVVRWGLGVNDGEDS